MSKPPPSLFPREAPPKASAQHNHNGMWAGGLHGHGGSRLGLAVIGKAHDMVAVPLQGDGKHGRAVVKNPGLKAGALRGSIHEKFPPHPPAL